MGAIGNDKKGSVMTVLGPIAAADMGTTLIHEHLFVDLRPPAKRGPDLSDIEISIEELGVLHRQPFHLAHNVVLDDVPTVQEELEIYREAGGRTIVDCSNSDIARSPAKLVEVARETGTHTIMGSGHYRRPYHPPRLAEMGVEDIMEEIVSEVTAGVGEKGPRAGIIGEIGVSAPMEPQEERVLIAAA